MENNPDMESFERFIKQHSDDFRMYPTKRVWYSLYNNLHPSRKWPSISMCIVLLTALFLIGFLNTNTNHSNIAVVNTNATEIAAVNNVYKDQVISIQNTELPAVNSTDNALTAKQLAGKINPLNAISETKKIQANLLTSTSQQQKIVRPVKSANGNSGELVVKESTGGETVAAAADVVIEDENIIVAAPAEKTMAAVDAPTSETGSTENAAATANTVASATSNSLIDLNKSTAGSIEYATLRAAETATAGNVSISESLLGKTAVPENEPAANSTVITNLTDKSWIENYALYNKPAPKKWKGKLAWQAYFTPSVSYRKLFNNAAGKSIGSLGTGMLGSTDATLSKEVTQSASIGLEAGVGLQYPVLKGIKIKAGMQLNYTRYNIAAFENSHPSITSLEMLSEINGKPYELYKTTAYSNNAGLVPVTLHSQTFQLSMPVGADIKLAGNDLFEWYAGAAIQPTFVFAASSYLVSTDRRNYVKDHSMLNHFNMNAAFETYISFKSAGGLTWQIGPQLRKQLYSTSTKFYTVEERLMGYGLKVGFIKKF